VIANLLHNAAKYSETPCTIELTVEPSPVPEVGGNGSQTNRANDDPGRTGVSDGSSVTIRVKDGGLGIAPELLPNIFDLFVQGDRSLERQEGGLGIGLTVVRKLVEMHGGTITARSDGAGKGSEFAVTLPVLGGSPAELPREQDVGPAAAAARRILIVDDNVDAAESMALLLRDVGHEVYLAHDGPHAIRTAQIHVPEFIVLDIGLPGMSGYEVARELRKEVRFKDTVLVALTGYGQEDDRRRAREAGFNHHLVKPVKSIALQRLLAGQEEKNKE
jgi:two-component system CheB/CheR fusion protein